MLNQNFYQLLTKASYNYCHVRYSALFVNGMKATESYVHVHPHIDFAEKINNKNALQIELDKRKSTYSLEKLHNLWSVFYDLNQRKMAYEKKKQEISTEISRIMKNNPDSEDLKSLKLKIDLIKENLRKLKVPLWSAEECAILEYLKLPNKLHVLTPENQSKILYTHSKLPDSKKKHLEVGKANNLIDFQNNQNYYLKGDTAIFELGSKFFFSKMLKENNFIQFSNPDFVKSVIVEGCGIDHLNADSTFVLHHTEDSKVNKDIRLHLTGAGSLCSFMAYHSKNVIPAKYLPMKYFSMGRQYVPSAGKEDSLCNVSQSSVVQIFGAMKDSTQLDEEFDLIVGLLKDIYTCIGCHFRLIYCPAHKLQMWESLRLSVEMYLPSVQNYVEVGNVSISGDFISKRLMFTYVDKKESIFPYLLSGTVLNVPKLIACLLEQDNGFVVPSIFQVDKWSMQM